MEKQVKNDVQTYTVVSQIKCPKDSGDSIHTITYKKATCTSVDDIILNFHCSRNSQCLDCQQDYL